MKITLSRYAGFCDGVERAYEIITKLAKNPKTKKPIYVLGSLVHNDDVVKKIEALGVKKLRVEENLEKTLQSAKKKIGTIVVTAHGMGPKIYELAKKKGITLVDTTCPRVIKAQCLAKLFFDKLYQIVIIGDRGHKETKGINEWANNGGVFLETKKDLKSLKLDPEKKIAVLSQTTQDEDFVAEMSGAIKKKYPQTEIMETVCMATHDRQNEVKNLAQKNEVMIVIGSPDSANSTRLWQIARKINKKSYFIERADELKNEWFSACGKIGVAAGASTPRWVIREVIKTLEKIGKRQVAKKLGLAYNNR